MKIWSGTSSSVLGRERMETHRFYFSVGRENETKDFPSLGPFLAMSLNRSFIAIVFFPIEHPTGLLHPFTTPNNPHPLHKHLQIFITRNYFSISPNRTNRNTHWGPGTGVMAVRKVTVDVVCVWMVVWGAGCPRLFVFGQVLVRLVGGCVASCRGRVVLAGFGYRR